MAPITLANALALLAFTSSTILVTAEPKHYYARNPNAMNMKRATGGYYPTGTGFGTGTGYARPTGTGFSTGYYPPSSSSITAGGPGGSSVQGTLPTNTAVGPASNYDCQNQNQSPVTVTVSNTETVTVTINAATSTGGAGEESGRVPPGVGPTSQATGPPYTIPGQSTFAGGPIASGTGVASASAPTGSAYATGTFGSKRGLEMRGLNQERKRGLKERKEGWWFA